MINRLFKTLSSIVFFLWASYSPAATLLPNGEQTFLDSNGNPLASGTVTFYIPNTTTLKTTWKDSGQTILNTNPVILDASGRAIIYGSGAYRQIVKDSAGNTIWDQLTADTSAAFNSWGGTSTGSANVQVVNAANFTNNAGQSISFIAGFTNTGAMTLNGISVLKDTVSGPTGLNGGEIVTGNNYTVVYDSGGGVFQLVAYPQPIIGSPTNIASATTTDIGTIASHNANITGTTTITSFGSTASTIAPFYLLQFTGALQITASANILTTDGRNITTVAGASALTVYRGSGIWQIITYSGAQVPAGMIGMFNLASCPTGWVSADGTGGTADLRGRFPRGYDTGAGINPGVPVGTLQAHQFQDHVHAPAATTTYFLGNPGPGGPIAGGGAFTYDQALLTGNPANGSHGTETRPYTTVLLACQKN